jgi:hypothetical protein
MRKAMIAIVALAAPAAAMQGQGTPRADTRQGMILFYDHPNYNGLEYGVQDATRLFQWPPNIRSLAIHPGDRWQLCARPRFHECIVLDRSIPDATMVGITRSIGSVRPAPEGAPAQDPE